MAILSTKTRKKKPNYFREVQSELSKVSWTSKEELIVCTKVVITATFIFGLGIYIVDLLVRSAIGTLNTLASLIGG